LVGTRTWRNILGQVDDEIKQYRTTLIRLRDDFLARAIVTAEVTVLGVQNDVSNTTPANRIDLIHRGDFIAKGDVDPSIRSWCVILVIIRPSDR
jgi:hypothetical protein